MTLDRRWGSRRHRLAHFLVVEKSWPRDCNHPGMAKRITWAEMLTVMTEAEVRDRDAITLESYRWQLLEASARLSTTRLIIDRPSPVLDATEAALLQPLETTTDPMARLIRDLGPTATRRQGRRSR
jgi:hypothetical protein